MNHEAHEEHEDKRNSSKKPLHTQNNFSDMKIKHTIQTTIALSALLAITGCGDAPTSESETAPTTSGNTPAPTASNTPVAAKPRNNRHRESCVSNLKQIGIAFRIYMSDNEDRLPWQALRAEGGSAESTKPKSNTAGLDDADGKPIFDANAWEHFLALSNEVVSPKVLRCPADDSRTQANSFSTTKPKGVAGKNVIPFDENSVSYFLRTDRAVDETRPNEILAVCPHHGREYNVLLVSGEVKKYSWSDMSQHFQNLKPPVKLPKDPPQPE